MTVDERVEGSVLNLLQGVTLETKVACYSYYNLYDACWLVTDVLDLGPGENFTVGS